MRKSPTYRVVETPAQETVERGTAAQRGYNSRWRTYSQRFLLENPFCIVCGAQSKLTDHILPVIQDGSDSSGFNDDLFWEIWNHQPLCQADHSRKTKLHDQRLSENRKILLRGVADDVGETENENDRRNALLQRSLLWPAWYDLETGERVVLKVRY